ncbi:unnamed protein product [Heterobilharzia americana]|nr:unnamed protein product [Heterobilharzia americana]
MFNSQWTLLEISLYSVSINSLQLFLLLLPLLLLLLLIASYKFNYSNPCQYSRIFDHYNYLPSKSSSILLSFIWISCTFTYALYSDILRLLHSIYKLLGNQRNILLGNIISSNSSSNSSSRSSGQKLVYNITEIPFIVCITLYNLVDHLVRLYIGESRLWNIFNIPSTWTLTSLTYRNGHTGYTNTNRSNIGTPTKLHTYHTHLNHGMNKLFILYLGVLFYGVIWGITFVEGKPIQNGIERRYGELNLHPSKSSSLSSSSHRIPKVVMPPYDLGFRGQKTGEANKVRSLSSSSSVLMNEANNNFDHIRGFQSDETYDENPQSYIFSPSSSSSISRNQKRQRYQRVNRDNYEPEENFNDDDDNMNLLSPKLSPRNQVIQNVRSYGQSVPEPQLPLSQSSLPGALNKEVNDRRDYKRVNLAPSRPFSPSLQQQQQQQRPSYSLYNPYEKVKNFHDPLYISDQKAVYNDNDQQFSQQDGQWGRSNNHYQPNMLYDGHAAYMNREIPSFWYPSSHQINSNNNPLENAQIYGRQQPEEQPSETNSYPRFDIPNHNANNKQKIKNKIHGRINTNVGQFSYFKELPDIQLSHLINQYQMELLRRQAERLQDSDFQLESAYYGQSAGHPSLYPSGYYTQDHGIHLSGSKNHDYIIQRFNNLANQRLIAGVNEFFDELDHNRDGVITLDELQNYLMLHEIHFAR